MTALTLFVSHSHHDTAFCHRLLAYLEENLPDADIFYDEEKLHGGDDWIRRIQHEVIARPLFVVVLSPAAVAAEWVREETNLALRESVRVRERRVIPVRYQECDVNQLAPLLQNRQIIDCAFQDEALGFAQLVTALQEQNSATGIMAQTPSTGHAELEHAREYAAQAHDAFVAEQWRTAARLGQLAVTAPGNERDADLWGELGISLIHANQFAEGITALDKALQVNRYRSDLWCAKAKALIKKGDSIEAALAAWNHALVSAGTKEGKLDILLDDVFNALFQAERYSDALGITEEALEIDPRSARAWLQKGDALCSLDRYSEAMQAWDALLAIDERNVDAWLRKGSALEMHFEQPQEALALYAAALSILPQAPRLWDAKGYVLSRLHREDESNVAYNRALTTCDLLLATTQNDDTIWTTRGDILSHLERHDEAQVAYDRALVIKPNDIAILTAKASAALVAGKTEDAIRVHDQILSIDPSNLSARHQKSWGMITLGRYGEAIKVYDDWIAIERSSFWAWDGKANILKQVADSSNNEVSQYEEALKVLDHALTIRADYGPAWDDRGELLIKLKQWDEAIAAFDHCLSLDPRWSWALIHKGDVLYEIERYAESLAAYEQAQRIRPDYAHIWDSKGRALIKLGREHEARTAFARAEEMRHSDK